MRGIVRAAIALAALAGCASVDGDANRAPLCGPLETLAPRPDRCEPGELGEFEQALSSELVHPPNSALVRVELDEDARVRAVCVEEGPGYGADSARRAVAEHLDAVRALPPGPACAAGKRLDLNRYEAKWAEVHDRESRCTEQTRITRETQGPTTVRDRTVRGSYGVYDREFEWCMEHDADWIVLDQPGSTRPLIYVRPEGANPSGSSGYDAYDTASRCTRKSRVFEKRAACIESEGWERLEPPPR
jgi:hypothetical protein